jgi:hypothetical protein
MSSLFYCSNVSECKPWPDPKPSQSQTQAKFLPQAIGLSQAKLRPGLSHVPWLWLGKSEAKAKKSQAKAKPTHH